jgi:hypothetical protein
LGRREGTGGEGPGGKEQGGTREDCENKDESESFSFGPDFQLRLFAREDNLLFIPNFYKKRKFPCMATGSAYVHHFLFFWGNYYIMEQSS